MAGDAAPPPLQVGQKVVPSAAGMLLPHIRTLAAPCPTCGGTGRAGEGPIGEVVGFNHCGDPQVRAADGRVFALSACNVVPAGGTPPPAAGAPAPRQPPGAAADAGPVTVARKSTKSQVHSRLPIGGGNPTTEFGRRAKTLFDPVLVPLVRNCWQAATLLLIFIPVALFYVVGEVLHRTLLPVGTHGVVLQPAYDFFRTQMLGSWAGHALYPSFISTIFTWVVCGAFAAVDLTLPKWAAAKRIQQGREAGEFPPLGLWNAVRYQIGVYMYLVPVFVYQYVVGGPTLYGPPWLDYCQENCSELPDAAPTVLEFCVHFAVSFAMFDMAYWYWHWMHHHHRLLWVKVHRHHHEYNAPFAFVSQYLHPFEFMATGLFSIMPSVALKGHPFTIWVCILWGVWLSIDAHSGFDLPIGLQHFPMGIFGGAHHHDEHHRRPNSNFQPFFCYWEKLCGTYFAAGSKAAGAVMFSADEKNGGRTKAPAPAPPATYSAHI